MTHKSKARAQAQTLLQLFENRGAQVIEAEVFQDAQLLLDLYGEDIRARAYTVTDPVHGEQMLRPDFTVPVAQMHLNGSGQPAHYTYMGEVFRRQEDHPERRNVYFQVGYEIFDAEDSARADAEVFAIMKDAMTGIDCDIATSDIRVIVAAIEGLGTTPERQGALMRHLWRPHRFRALLHRYANPRNITQERLKILGQRMSEADVTGLRSASEINQRLASLEADYHAPALDSEHIELIEQLLKIKGSSTQALRKIQDLAIDMPALKGAAQGLDQRLAALDARGQAPDDLPYEQSYGRTTMEYYDGFTFGFFLRGDKDHPPVVTGGRYDALTMRLGGARAMPAVGAVIRPDVIVDWQEGHHA